jgi:hypothetical protein
MEIRYPLVMYSKSRWMDDETQPFVYKRIEVGTAVIDDDKPGQVVVEFNGSTFGWSASQAIDSFWCGLCQPEPAGPLEMVLTARRAYPETAGE